MKIKRTDFANQPTKAAVTVYDPWTGYSAMMADTVHEGSYPTHSRILGPDGKPLEYEPRPAMGFDLRRRG